MNYKIAKPFSSGTEYEVFRYNYCDNECEHHKERKDGFPEFTENGGCPIESRIEDARLGIEEFPNVLLEVWDDGNCVNWHYCPFYRKAARDD